MDVQRKNNLILHVQEIGRTRIVKQKIVNMWPMKPKKDMWSNGSAMLIEHKIVKETNSATKRGQELSRKY